MHIIKFLLIYFVFVIPESGYSNNIIVNKPDFNKNLSSHFINSMVIDKDGFLWLASENEIYRYDGYELKPLNELFEIES